jgi:hypothetical protein
MMNRMTRWIMPPEVVSRGMTTERRATLSHDDSTLNCARPKLTRLVCTGILYCSAYRVALIGEILSESKGVLITCDRRAKAAVIGAT